MSSTGVVTDEQRGEFTPGRIYSSLRKYKERQDWFEQLVTLERTNVQQRLTQLEDSIRRLSSRSRTAVDTEVLKAYQARIDDQDKKLENCMSLFNRFEESRQKDAARDQCGCYQRTETLLERRLIQRLAAHSEQSDLATEERYAAITRKVEDLSARLAKVESTYQHVDAFKSIDAKFGIFEAELDNERIISRKAQEFRDDVRFEEIGNRLKSITDQVEGFQESSAAAEKACQQHKKDNTLLEVKLLLVDSNVRQLRGKLAAQDKHYMHLEKFTRLERSIQDCSRRVTKEKDNIFGIIAANTETYNKKFDAIDEDISHVRDRTQSAEKSIIKRSEFEDLNVSLESCKHRLESIEQASVAQAPHNRLLDMSAKVDRLDERTTSSEAQVTTLGVRLGELESAVDSIKQQALVDPLEEHMRSNDQRLSTLADDVSAIRGEVKEREDAHLATWNRWQDRLDQHAKDHNSFATDLSIIQTTTRNRDLAYKASAAKYDARLDRLENEGTMVSYSERLDRLENDRSLKLLEARVNNLLVMPTQNGGSRPIPPNGTSWSDSVPVPDAEQTAVPELQLPSPQGSVETETNIAHGQDEADEAETSSRRQMRRRQRRYDPATPPSRQSNRRIEDVRPKPGFVHWKEAQRSLPRRPRGYRIVKTRKVNVAVTRKVSAKAS